MAFKGFSLFRRDLVDLWKGLLEYLGQHRILKRIVVTVSIVFSLAVAINLLDLAFKPAPDVQKEILKTRFAKSIQAELQKIHFSSQFVLDSISIDPQTPFYGQLLSRQASALFLKNYRDLWLYRHSLGSVEKRSNEQRKLSFAYYDQNNRLQSWYTESLCSPGFDTVYLYGKTLERRNKFTIIDSDEFNLYYVSARKIVNKQGTYSGYILIKYKIAANDLAESNHTRWLWRDADDSIKRGIYISNSKVLTPTPVEHLLFIDSNDRTTTFGSLKLDSNYWLHEGQGNEAGGMALVGAGAEIVLVLILLAILYHLYSERMQHQRLQGQRLIFSVAAIMIGIRLILYLSVWPVFLLSLFPYLHCAVLPLSAEGFFFDPLQQIISEVLLLVFLAFIPTHIFYSSKENSNRHLATYILYTSSLLLLPALLFLGYNFYCQFVLEPLTDSIGGITAIIGSSLSQSLALSLCAAIILLVIHYSHIIEFRLTRQYVSNRTFHGPILYLFLLIQLFILFSVVSLDYHQFGWNVAIGVLLIASFFRAARLTASQQFFTSKPIGRPSITLLTYLIAFGAVLYSFQLEQARIAIATRQARIKIAKTLYPSEAYNETFAAATLKEYATTIKDTSIKDKQAFLLHSFLFWRNFILSHPEYKLSFEIVGHTLNERLYSIDQTGSGFLFAADSSKAQDRSLHSVSISDTTANSGFWGIPITMHLHLFYQEQHRLLPSDRLSDILWASNNISFEKLYSGFALVDPEAGHILQGRFPEGYFDYSQLRNSYSREGSYETPSHDYIYVSSERLTPERTRAIAFIPFASFKDFLHIAAEVIDISLVFSLCCCLFLLLWRVIEQQKRIVMLSLQERSLLIVLAAIIISFFVISRVVESSLKTAINAASEESFSTKTSGIKNQLLPVLFNDSTHIQQQLDHEAAARNCDLALFTDQNILYRSTCPDCFEHALLPVILPTTFDWKLAERSNSETTIASSVQSTPLNVWISAAGPGNSNPKYKIMVVQQLENYTTLQQHVNAYIFDGMTVMALLILGFASYLAARSVRPLRQIKEAVETIASGSLAVTLPSQRSDEIGEVIEAFNTMTKELATSRERVAQTEREGAWREMARQVAHEIKNPLTPMKLSIQHVQHAFEHQDTNFQNIFRRVLRTLNEQIDVMTRIATEFARFGEMPRRRYGFISLPKVVDSAVALFDAERSRIRFAVDIPQSIGRIYGDEEEFRRALVNLIKNALQAIDKWGIILVTAEERSGLIYLKISDSGAGMNEETLRKAFDPNFSTKTSGMGLGLAIVKKTITDMSGTIRVESVLGKGTTFFIELPSREGTAQS